MGAERGREGREQRRPWSRERRLTRLGTAPGEHGRVAQEDEQRHEQRAPRGHLCSTRAPGPANLGERYQYGGASAAST